MTSLSHLPKFYCTYFTPSFSLEKCKLALDYRRHLSNGRRSGKEASEWKEEGKKKGERKNTLKREKKDERIRQIIHMTTTRVAAATSFHFLLKGKFRLLMHCQPSNILEHFITRELCKFGRHRNCLETSSSSSCLLTFSLFGHRRSTARTQIHCVYL